jgi:AmmeMemoRadiSam system protein B
LKKANLLEDIKNIKGIIGPHAGYLYSGPTAAFAYKYIDQLPKDKKYYQK